MKKTNTDVQIYIHKLMEGINQIGLVEEMEKEWGLMDKDEFRDLLEENLTITSSINFEEAGDPTLDESQFTKTLTTSLTEYTIETLAKEGVITKNLEEGAIENTYTINPNVNLEEDGEEGN